LVVVIVNVLVPLPGSGVRLNEYPVASGSTPMLSVTGSLKPFVGVSVTVYVPALPRFTVRLPGVAAIVKSWTGAAFTTRLTPVVCVSVPSVALMVRGNVPVATLEIVVIVTVDDQAPALYPLDQDGVAPDGSPNTENVPDAA
jgi:hypothetical protein